MAGTADGKSGVQHAFFPAEMVGQRLNLFARTLHHYHFRANVIFKVYVRVGQNFALEMMLYLDEPFAEAARVMIVRQRYRAELHVVCLPVQFNDIVAYHVPDIFRPIRILSLLHERLELLEKRLLNRHRKTYQF